MGEYPSIFTLYNLFSFDKVGNMTFAITSTGIETSAVAVNTTTGDQGDGKGCLVDRNKRDDLHVAENCNGD